MHPTRSDATAVMASLLATRESAGSAAASSFEADGAVALERES